MRERLTHALKSCCPLRTTDQYTPTRLVHLGESGTDIPHLVLTRESRQDDNGQVFEYAALSYCWGPPTDASTNTKTLKASLGSFLKGIDFDHMSPAIKDAVTVCRALSIRYLWVDTLCIIQDDQRDWEQESENMGRVFQSAYVTIGALASTSCSKSFVERSMNSAVIPFRSVIDPDKWGEYVLTHNSAKIDGEWFTGYPLQIDPVTIDTQYSEWEKRAWIFQEASLSQRLLLFGKSRCHFVCRHTTSSENISAATGRPFAYFPKIFEELSGEDSNESHVHRIYLRWYYLVSSYNPLLLTKREDKLPALSGMASYAAKFIGDQYIAGLWRNDFAQGLVWHISPMLSWDNLKNTLSQNPANAPSWSYFAHDDHFSIGTIDFVIDLDNTCDLTLEFSVLDVDIDLAGSNLFGRINHASLIISGKLFLLPPKSIRKSRRTVAKNASLRKAFQLSTWIIQIRGCTTYQCHLDWVHPGRILDTPVGLTLLLTTSHPAYITRNGPYVTQGDRKHRVTWGLLLIPTGVSGEYYRVGVFSTSRTARTIYDPFQNCESQTIRLV